MDPADTDWEARIHQRGGGEEDEEEEEVDRGDGVSETMTCHPPVRCARRKTNNHGRMTQDDTRPQGRESGTSPLHQWRRTSSDSDGVSQACSTLRGYDVKEFYNVVTDFFHFQERSEYIDFSPDSIARIHAVPYFPLYLFDSRSPYSTVKRGQHQNALLSVIFPFKGWSIGSFLSWTRRLA